MKKSVVNHYLLLSMLWLVLFRSTNMGFGYPTAEYMLGGISFLPQKLIQIGVLGLLIIYCSLNVQKVLNTFFRIPPSILFMLFIVVISCLLSDEKGLAIRFLISVVVVSLPVYLYYNVYGKDALFFSFINFLIIILLLSLVYSVLFSQYAFMTANHSGALRGMFVHKNGFGGFVALMSIIFYAGLFSDNGLKKKWNLAYFTLSMLCVAMSLSSSAIVIFLVGLVSYHAIGSITKMRSTISKIGVLVLYTVAGGMVYALASILIPLVLEMLGKDATLTGRTLLWETLFNIAMEKPVLGYGIGVFLRPEIMHNYTELFGWAAKTSHNSYLDLLLGMGVPFTLLYIFLCFSYLFKGVCATPANALEQTQVRIVNTFAICTFIYAFSSSGAFLSPSYSWVMFFLVMLIQYKLVHNSRRTSA